MQAITGALVARVRPAAVLLAAAAIAFSLLAGSAAASTAYTAESAQPHPIPWTGWNGRPIERPQKAVDHALLSKASYPSGWSAGAVGFGTGYHTPNGSQRVREVQRRLTRLGYHTGPIDGLYGPLTRSAVQWFQIKHGLRPTGVVAATTLMGLRDTKSLTRQGQARAKAPATPKAPSAPKGTEPTRSSPSVPKAPAEPAQDSSPAWLLPLLAALLVLALGAAVLTLVGASRGARRRRDAAVLERPRPAGLPKPRPRPEVVALGYVSGSDPDETKPDERAITEACGRNGWVLARLIRDARPTKGRAIARPGLAFALEQLADGKASRLVVHKLEHLARSVVELRVVLGWFMRTGIALTALDVGLDTSTPEGKTALQALMSITGSEQAPIRARTRSGMAPARSGGRPAVSDQPELADRIRAMRGDGMTLQAIADALNDERVPTVRGGERWRPSSVQSVLGYRRFGAKEW